MVNRSILQQLRCSICAIGYITVPTAEFVKDVRKPYFKIVGTGFLVRATTVITNRHVIQGLLASQARFGFADQQRLLMFVYPHRGTVFEIAFCVIKHLGVIGNEELDVGFVAFARRPEPEFTQVKPVTIQVEAKFEVGEPIVISGYPYGHAMLHRNGKVYRWGPVVQQGYVSAISPYDTSARPDEVLLDVRIAKGMSGAPIFRPHDGTVIGLLHSGWEATTALGLPLTQNAVNQWLMLHDQAHNPTASA